MRSEIPSRSTTSDLLLGGLIDEEYAPQEIPLGDTRRPFYGSRKMVVFLKKVGHLVNRKRVRRLVRLMGRAGMAPGPNTSRPHPEHKIYPYLLRGVPVVRPNQVWSTDITYIRLPRGFAYRSGPAELDRISVFLSDISTGF
jgi:putative transposase